MNVDGDSELDQIAMQVIAGGYGNGAERVKALQADGFDYDKIQSRVNEIIYTINQESVSGAVGGYAETTEASDYTEDSEMSVESSTKEEPTTEYPQTSGSTESLYSINDLEFHGVINWNGYTYTFYSERVLPGNGLNIPGRYTSGGYVRDGDGYIVCASDYYPKGTVLNSPFGSQLKVYDAFGTGQPSYRIDIYTR